MNYESQIKAVAKARGWKNVGPLGATHDRYYLVGLSPDGTPLSRVPYYPKDLDAIHEVVVTIIHPDPFLRRRYLQALDEITGDQWNTVDATAAQRVQAVLTALEVWEESPTILDSENVELVRPLPASAEGYYRVEVPPR